MTGPALRHDVVDPISPLDAQMGVWPLRNVPADMENALLGPCPDPVTGAPRDLPLYAVIEGARFPALVDLLTDIDSVTPHAGLFQGQLADDLGEAAPFLVKLDAGNRILRMLLTDMGDDDAPTGLMPKETAVFLRSASPLQDLRRHLRHFTQLDTDDGRKVYFRFWEPASAALYFDHIATEAGQIAHWFCHPRAPIARMIIPGRTPDGWLLHSFTPDLPIDAPRQPVIMTAQTREVLRLARYNANVLQAVLLLRKTFPDELASRPPRDMRRLIDRLYRRMMPLGFHSKKALFMLATWEIFYGPGFENRDPEGQLAHHLATPGREDDKIAALRTRLEALSPAPSLAVPPAIPSHTPV